MSLKQKKKLEEFEGQLLYDPNSFIWMELNYKYNENDKQNKMLVSF